MRRSLLFLSILVAFPAAAQGQEKENDDVIVVTGTPLSETEKKLQDCLARHCSPRDDIEATLAHAENQFIAGDYAGARRTLAKGHDRNYRHAKTLPVEVADLDRAYGRLTNLNGFPDRGKFLQIRSLEALKAGLDEDDSRVLVQRLMVADELARAGRDRAAEDVYRAVAKRARKIGRFDVQGHAMLREAVMYAAIASTRSQYRDGANHRIRALENSREPGLAPFRTAAKLLRAQLAFYNKDRKALDKAIASIPPQTGGKPMLVYSPPIALDRTKAITITKTTDPEWIDVAFRIATDGTVRDVETLRDSGNVEKYWPRRVHEAVTGRRYVPQGSDGARRIERFSYVHDSVMATGSRMRQRVSPGRITSLDITSDPSGS